METTTKKTEIVEIQQLSENQFAELKELIISKITNLNGAEFIGVRNYINKNGEVANLVVISNFSYLNAVNADIETLKSLTSDDFKIIENQFNVCNISGIQYAENQAGKDYLLTGKLPKEGTAARDKVLASLLISKSLQEVANEMIMSFENNKSNETRSSQSQAKIEAYLPVCKGIKLCKATNQVHLYALAHSKIILQPGVYPESNPRQLTKQKQAIERYCKSIAKPFKTSKFREFIVNPNQLDSIAIHRDEIFLK